MSHKAMYLQRDLDARGLTLKHYIINALLESLPSEYKQRAMDLFWSEPESQNRTVGNAFQYSLGGFEYRLRKIIHSVNGSQPRQRKDKHV
jgi:hypothetical protein